MRTIDPTEYPPLASFSCGNDSESAEDADQIVGELLQGEPPDATTRVAEHPDTNALMAVSARVPRALIPTDDPPLAGNPIAIGLLGVDAAFHGTLLLGGTMSLGAYMVRDVLREIALEHDNDMPPVWAIVAMDNKPALNLCRAYGFELQDMTETHQIAYRPPETRGTFGKHRRLEVPRI